MKIRTIYSIFFWLIFSNAWAQDPTVNDFWFHRNPTSSFDTGLLRMMYPEPSSRDVIISIVGEGVDTTHPYLKDILSTASPLSDSSGDGTHVAGVIASFAKLSPSRLFKKIKILPLKINPRSEITLASDIVQAIDRSISSYARVILFTVNWKESISTPEVRAALKRAQDKNIILVSAAGDHSQSNPAFPCAHQGVICVAAANKEGKVARFSNTGPWIDFVAPGVDISGPLSRGETKSFGSKNTSFSSAALVSTHVASLIAHAPELGHQEIYHRLVSAADGNQGFPSLNKIFIPPSKNYALISSKDNFLVSAKNTGARFRFDVVNLGAQSNSVTLSYESKSPGVILQKSQEVISFRKGESAKTVFLPFTFESLRIDRRIEIAVKLTQLGESTDYSLPGVIHLDSTGVEVGSLPSKPGAIWKTLKSSKGKYVYSWSDSKELSLYSVTNRVEKLGSTTLPTGYALLFHQVQLVDADGDGTEEVFVLAQDSAKKVFVAYYDLELKEKLSGEYIGAEVFVETQRPHFIKFNFEGSDWRVPIFLTEGSVAQLDTAPGDFSVIDPDRHLYWLEPKRLNGVVRFYTRTLSHERWRQRVFSKLTVGLHSLMDLMVLAEDRAGLYVIGGIKDSDGITQSGIIIDVSLQSETPRVTSIGFDRPLGRGGMLLPFENEARGNVLFIASPSPHLLKLSQISVTSEGSRSTDLGEATAQPDEFIHIPSITHSTSGPVLWLRSTNKLSLLEKRSQISYALAADESIEKLSSGPEGFIVDHAKSVSVIMKKGSHLISPISQSLAPEGCAYMGHLQKDFYFSCPSRDRTRLIKFSSP